MREIKFRAWDTKHKIMHIVWQLEFSDEGNEPFSYEAAQVRYQGEWLWIQRDEYILMQFTGLLDRNGKEADWWEDDLIQSIDRQQKGIIRYSTVSGGFAVYDKDNIRIASATSLLRDFWRKIGNRFENPELLEAK